VTSYSCFGYPTSHGMDDSAVARWLAMPAHELFIGEHGPLQPLELVAMLSVFFGFVPKRKESGDLIFWEWVSPDSAVVLILFLSGTMQGGMKIAFNAHDPERFKMIKEVINSWPPSAPNA